MTKVKHSRKVTDDTWKYAAAHALANFLFPKDGEWEFYVSPKGYKFLKVRPKKEQAA